ncbi:allantoate amidohydrolase [Alteromonas sp. a30]|uniref:allantoate amidohydrolase n=1 Tax=Alteromonas sp. a30 TaxID=2730917 RepID=UPI00227F1990|nr:allantoate amidohydrolase [Alteromonas sp. a30]MCY7293882.1 allantoate amidohydrolase [Alteromonas sp. a30]
MTDFADLAQEVFDQCETLAQFSQAEGMMDRRFLTKEHQQANAQTAFWMEAAGMQTWQDEAGNQYGRFECSTPDAPTLLFGSHLDTVPNGGKYDGILGVLTPIALVKYLNQTNQALPFHIEIVGFGDEEGTRFGITLIGSRAISGNWDDNWLLLQDANGVNLSQAMAEFGLDYTKIQQASRKSSNLLAFVEIHIEQGPVLEKENLPVGIVSSIAGAKRAIISLKGKAGHAGTVPMHLRQDAVVAFAHMAVAINDIAKKHGVVATVGYLENKPNAVNVIPSRTQFSLDIRSEYDALRDEALAEIESQLAVLANEYQVELEWKQTHSASAVACDPALKSMLESAVADTGTQPLTLFSGAGHDAMELANLCPMAMLFVRCKEGISHHPDEAIQVGDVEASLHVLARFIERFAEENR